MFPLWQKSLYNAALFVIFYGDQEAEQDEEQKTGGAVSSGVDPQARNCLKEAIDSACLLSSRLNQGRTGTIHLPQQKPNGHPWGDKVGHSL